MLELQIDIHKTPRKHNDCLHGEAEFGWVASTKLQTVPPLGQVLKFASFQI